VRHETLLALLLVLALAVLASRSDRFLTVDNLFNQGRLMTEVGLISIAMTFVIVTGGIDLSVGSIVGMAAIFLGVLWKNAGLPLPLAIAAVLLIGTLAGLFNGLVITRFRVPPLIATLATLALYRGIAEGVSEARSVRGYPDWFAVLGQGDMLGMPTQLWVLGAAALAAGLALGVTVYGRTLYAIGSNATAARFSGLRVDGAILATYAASGFAAALAGVILVSRVSTTRSDMGSGYELTAITAVVLGGTSIFGGRGTVVGTVLGLILMQALNSGLSLAGVKGDGTIVMIGVILIGAVLLANLFRRDGG
jgi:rhamnose transport system permease protein